jgi:hypothetical protein
MLQIINRLIKKNRNTTHIIDEKLKTEEKLKFQKNKRKFEI